MKKEVKIETEVDEEVKSEAEMVHAEMRQLWAQFYDKDYDPKILEHFTRVLFRKRKDVDQEGAAPYDPEEPAEEDSAGAPQPGSEDLAFASQAETGRAILSVLKVRKRFLQSKNITDDSNDCNKRHSSTCLGYNEGPKDGQANQPWRVSSNPINLVVELRSL